MFETNDISLTARKDYLSQESFPANLELHIGKWALLISWE